MDENAVEKSLEEADDDMFDEVFGEDEERELAKKKMKEKVEKEKEKEKMKKKKGKEKTEEIEESEDSEEESAAQEEQEELAGVMQDVDKKMEEMKEEKNPVKEVKKEIKEKIGKKLNAKKIGKPEIAAMPKKESLKEKEEELLEESLHSKINPQLELLSAQEENAFFIGRKKGTFDKYADEAGLFIGRIEEEGQNKQKILLDGLNPHVVFVCGARGSGKCLTGDTLITLENGNVLPIKELEDNNENVLALNHELKIGSTAKTEFFKRTVDKILKLRFRSGKEIKLTPEHPLLTINGWVPAEELSVGSRIATPRELPAFGNSKMKECDVKLLAYILAEGHIRNQFVLFSNQDEKIVEDFKKSVYEFDSNLRIEQHGPAGFRIAQKKKQIDISNIVRDKKGQFTSEGFVVSKKSSIAEWFISLGLYGKGSKEKFIPNEIFELNKEQLSLFLNRMFSCDGSIHKSKNLTNWQVSYSSSSEEMIKQVQHLLLRFGILAKLREKKVKCNNQYFKSFELAIGSKNMIKFIEEIGFLGKKEEKINEAIDTMLSITRNPNVDTIPREVWDFYKIENKKALSRKLGYWETYVKNSSYYAPSREKLARIAQVEGNKGIQILAESDIFWDKIVSVEEINEKTEVYDISVPNVHNFVANDIIVHNSYVLGVVAEELALKNKNVGVIVIDPVGVFWSMCHANKENKELKLLKEWGLEAKGLKNLRVFIPEGMKKETPKATYDSLFSMQPSLLSAHDWCLTFGIERFSPTGLLLEKALSKVKNGYKDVKGNSIAGKQRGFGLDDIIHCLEHDAELSSKERGYKHDSIRALTSRFEAAKSWGVFSKEGTPLHELSKEGQLSIIDTSFLDDSVTALVIGILARRILAARKLSTRREAAGKFDSKEEDIEEFLDSDIPATWLFIDEAHTLIPAGNVKTPASDALIEYVKQGRRPGCSLVFATQQPSAIDTKVLSQLDTIIAHKLVFNDDVKAIFKRTPTIIPFQYKRSSFIKSLPIGTALTGDRTDETSRAFVMKIRPRMSQHEGREAETVERKKELPAKLVARLAGEEAFYKLSQKKSLKLEKIEKIIKELNEKYSSDAGLDAVLDDLMKRGAYLDDEEQVISLVEEPVEEIEEAVKEEGVEEGEIKEGEEGVKEGIEEEEKWTEKEEMEEAEIAGEEVQLLSFPRNVSEKDAIKLVNKHRKKALLGVFGSKEFVDSVDLKCVPVYKIEFNYYNEKKQFVEGLAYVNSLSGEFLHSKGKAFVESTGLKEFYDLSREKIMLINFIGKGKRSAEFLAEKTELSKRKLERMLKELQKEGIVAYQKDKKGRSFFSLKKKFDLPRDLFHPLVMSLSKVPVKESEALFKLAEGYSKKDIIDLLKKMWPNVVVQKVNEIYWPVYEGNLKSEKGQKRKVYIDAVSGKKMNPRG